MTGGWKSSLVGHRTFVGVAVALVGLHLLVAASGGLIPPNETAQAEAARQITAAVTDEPATEGPLLLDPPLARWLAAGGMTVLGRSVLGARLLPVLAAALLVCGFALAVLRFFNARAAVWLTLSLLATPLWIGRIGQISPAILTAGCVALTACLLTALSTEDPKSRPRLAALVGALVGLAALAGGVSGLVVAGGTVVVSLALSPPARSDRGSLIVPVAAGLAGCGLLLLVAFVRDDSMDWPTADTASAAVRRVGYGLYPWMALVPLGLLRIASAARDDRKNSEAETAREPDRLATLGRTIGAWTAVALAVALFGVQPLEVGIVSAGAGLAALGGLALAFRSRPEALLDERAAVAVGAMGLLVVLRDLRKDPSLLTAAATGGEPTGLPAVPSAVYLGGLILVGAALLVVSSRLTSPQRRPAGDHPRIASAEQFGKVFIAVAVAGCALMILLRGIVPLAVSTSWSEVFATLRSERQDGEPIYAFHALGSDAAFFLGDDPIEVIDDARGVRAALSRSSDHLFFLTRTRYYRQLSEMIDRLTGERPRPINDDRRHRLLVVYDGRRPGQVSGPRPVVDQVPRGARRDPASLASGAIWLVGADIWAERARPGDTIALHLYLECRRRMSEDLTARIHLNRERGEGRATFDRVLTDGRLPTSLWREGEIVRDELEVVLPDDAAPGDWEIEVEIPPGDRGRGRSREVGEVRVME